MCEWVCSMCLLSQYLFLEVARFQICNLFRLYGFFNFFFFFNFYYIIFYLRRSPNVHTHVYWCLMLSMEIFHDSFLFLSLSCCAYLAGSFLMLPFLLLPLFSILFFSVQILILPLESCCFFAISLLDVIIIVFMNFEARFLIDNYVIWSVFDYLFLFSSHQLNTFPLACCCLI